MQETDQKELKKLIHDDTMDMDTIADLEKMISRKKIEKLHRYTIFYNDKRDAWYTCLSPIGLQKKNPTQDQGSITGCFSTLCFSQCRSFFVHDRSLPRMVGV